MERNIPRLADYVFDVCVVGAGIYGACVARDAALRGLSVALIDKGDFGNATSSNSQKIIHGGFRYLQNADIPRMLESIRERAAWLTIAPHLVHPLPFLIPTYKRSTKPKELIGLALKVYGLIAAFYRPALGDASERIPGGRVLSRQEALEMLPGIDDSDLTGAAMFHDAQMYSSERLLISVVKSAAEAGAIVANYVGAEGYLTDRGAVVGVRANDGVEGNRFDLRARVLVNTVGPWINQALGRLNGRLAAPHVALCKSLNVVMKGSLSSEVAVGLWGTGGRLFFATPWHGLSIVGTAQLPYHGEADGFRIDEADIQNFLAEVNQARPALALDPGDVVFYHGGLVPVQGNATRRGELKRSDRPMILDHKRDDGLDGLLSVVGVKFTTARSVAQRVVDRVFKKLGHQPPWSRTATTPVHGGSIGHFGDFLATARSKAPQGLDSQTVQHLVKNYGTAYSDVLRLTGSTGPEKVVESSNVLRAEVVHGVREEMANSLADIVFRRTELGAVGHPGARALDVCAQIMAGHLGWDASRLASEIRDVDSKYLCAGLGPARDAAAIGTHGVTGQAGGAA